MLILSAVLAAHLVQQPPTLTSDEWVRRPPIEYPARALSRDIRRGRVVLDCQFEASKAVDCTIVEETPADFGFGPEALRAVRRGVAVEGVEGRRAVRLDFILG